MDFMNRLFSGKLDEYVHRQFVRFGKGMFLDRAMISINRSKQTKISGSFEYSQDFIVFLSSIFPKAEFSGIVLSKDPITEFGPSAKKAGLYQTEIKQTLTSQQIQSILEKNYAILLDSITSDAELKCKKKLPKPGKGEGKVDDKFCSLILDEQYASKAMEFFFPYISPNIKKIKTKYYVQVEDIIAPEGEKDFEKIRLLAKRKGIITRISEVDKKEEKKELKFLA